MFETAGNPAFMEILGRPDTLCREEHATMQVNGLPSVNFKSLARMLSVVGQAALKNGIPVDRFSPSRVPSKVELAALQTLAGRDDVPEEFAEISSPLSLTREEFTQQFIGACREFANGRPITYMSTPVTGGTRKYDFLADRGKRSKSQLAEQEQADFARDVIGGNTDQAFSIAECLRDVPELGLVMDPSEISMPGWTQQMYLEHWLDVVHQLADRVVVAPGWEVSKGCVYEVRDALEKGVPVETAHGKPLDRETVLACISGEVQRLSQAGFEELTMEEILGTQGFLPEWYLRHQ